MYGQYFNIDESAFSIAPNPKYLFLSVQHQEALAHLLYGITRTGGFVLITGEIGTGKTTVCRSLFAEIPENTDIALIVNPKLNPDDLLASICDELNISYPEYQLTSKTYLNKLNERLISSHAEGRNTILIVDEAQNLSVDALETIRALTNLETDEQKLLQIILIGQPELRDRLSTHAMEQLNQRITARFHLHALSKDEVSAYIKHRLKVANCDSELFSKSNIDCIYKLTGGIPRLINVLCDRTLLGAFVSKQKKISNDIIFRAASESLGKSKKKKQRSLSLATMATWLIILALIASTASILIYEKSNDTLAVESENVKTPDKLSSKEIPAPIEEVAANSKEIDKHSNQSHVVVAEDKESNIDVKVELGLDDKEDKITVEKVPAYSPAIVEDIDIVESHDELIASEDVIQLSPKQWAYHMLFKSWGLEYRNFDVDPCVFAKENGLHCFSGDGDVSLLRRLNRPVILRKSISKDVDAYLFVKKINRGQVIVLEQSGEYKVSWEQIAESWQGSFDLLWKPLTDSKFIRPGSEGDFVKYIDKNLSLIFNRSPGWDDLLRYDPALVREVKAFQRIQKIAPDGVIGPLTQIYMNNLVNADVPKLR
jgi:general secretion pathway protein A